MDSATIRWSDLRAWHRPLVLLAASMGALAVVSVAGLVIDPRVLTGAPIWAKPLKFSISIALYALTLAWMIALVDGARARRWSSRLGTVVAVTLALEMVGIVGQVVRGRTSHFDVATPFDATLFSVMGVTVAVLFVAALGLGVLLMGQRALPTDLAWAVRLGVVVSLVGMSVGFLMTQPTAAQMADARAGRMTVSGAHTVGALDGGPGLPLLGWSTVAGDLRIGHFVGLHAMQALPLLALALAASATRVPVLADRRVRARLVVVGGAAWTGLTVLLTWQALRGRSVIAPDAVTLGVAALLVLATAGSVAVVVCRPVHDALAGRARTMVRDEDPAARPRLGPGHRRARAAARRAAGPGPAGPARARRRPSGRRADPRRRAVG